MNPFLYYRLAEQMHQERIKAAQRPVLEWPAPCPRRVPGRVGHSFGTWLARTATALVPNVAPRWSESIGIESQDLRRGAPPVL
jgi:hypothetical protein